MSEELYQATRGGVCAGVVVSRGAVVESAPILRRRARPGDAWSEAKDRLLRDGFWVRRVDSRSGGR